MYGESFEGNWTIAKSPVAWVITDASPYLANSAVERFEVVNELVKRELEIEPSEMDQALRPHYALITDSKDLFDKLAPFQSKSRDSQASGFYLQSDFNPLVLVNGASSSENWEIVYHEFTHHILNTHFGRLPVWADEGLAELFSTIRLNEAVASITRSRNRTLRYRTSTASFMEWEEFFQTSRDTLNSWIEKDGLKAQAYYAQAALLAELTHFGDPELKSGYWKLIERSSYKPITELDCQILLGSDFRELQRAIEEQLQESFRKSIPRKLSGKKRSTEIVTAKESSIASMIAIALSRGDKVAEARSLVAMNADEENPLWLAANSEVSIKLGNSALGLDYADRALQRSHPDPFLASLSVMRSVNEERLDSSWAIESLECAYERGDSSRLLFNLYFEISRNSGVPFENFTALAKKGIIIYPDIVYAIEFNRLETERILRN